MLYSVQVFRLLHFPFQTRLWPSYTLRCIFIFNFALKIKGIMESFTWTYMDQWWQVCLELTLSSFLASSPFPVPPGALCFLDEAKSQAEDNWVQSQHHYQQELWEIHRGITITRHSASFLMSRKAMKMCFITNFWQDVISVTASAGQCLAFFSPCSEFPTKVFLLSLPPLYLISIIAE